jgi:hypothetical protein
LRVWRTARCCSAMPSSVAMRAETSRAISSCNSNMSVIVAIEGLAPKAAHVAGVDRLNRDPHPVAVAPHARRHEIVGAGRPRNLGGVVGGALQREGGAARDLAQPSVARERGDDVLRQALGHNPAPTVLIEAGAGQDDEGRHARAPNVVWLRRIGFCGASPSGTSCRRRRKPRPCPVAIICWALPSSPRARLAARTWLLSAASETIRSCQISLKISSRDRAADVAGEESEQIEGPRLDGHWMPRPSCPAPASSS